MISSLCLSKRNVHRYTLGAMVGELFELGTAPFDWDSGRVRRVLLKEVLPGMETYVHATHGWRWTRLDTLIDGRGLSLAYNRPRV